ncbi:MAG: BlaI/MecI/CopY family transcriptional regulator [Planctomycetaceae bacterium]
MARKRAAHPTELELLILKVLWDDSPLPVRAIRQALAAGGRDLAHTTVITTLNVMVRKKYLKRRMSGNACLFAPRVAREQVSQGMLRDLVQQVFDGSTRAAVLALFNSNEIKPGELNELREIIKRRTPGAAGEREA